MCVLREQELRTSLESFRLLIVGRCHCRVRRQVEATEGQKESTFYSETLMVSTQVPGDDTKQGERGKLEDLTRSRGLQPPFVWELHRASITSCMDDSSFLIDLLRFLFSK